MPAFALSTTGRAVAGLAAIVFHVQPFLVVLLALLGPAAPTEPAADAWFRLAGIGLSHTGLVYVLVYALVHGAVPKLATPVIAVLSFLYPASAVLVDALVYGRIFDPGQAGGLCLIVLAGIGVTLGWSPATGCRGWRA